MLHLMKRGLKYVLFIDIRLIVLVLILLILTYIKYKKKGY